MNADNVSARLQHSLSFLHVRNKRHCEHAQMIRQLNRRNFLIVSDAVFFKGFAELAVNQRNRREIHNAGKAARLNLLQIIVQINRGVRRH